MIPPILHHVWPGRDPFRREFFDFRATWMRYHPDWSFLFWRLTQPGTDAPVDDPEVAELLADGRYSAVVKSDILRLHVLLKHGGIYVDTDFECLKSFNELLGMPTGFFCGAEDDKFLCPSLLAATPGHAFVQALRDAAFARLRASTPEHCNKHPNEVTGPFLLTELAHGRTDITVYPPHFFYPVGYKERHKLRAPTPGAYAKHHWNGTSPSGWTHRPHIGVSATR